MIPWPPPYDPEERSPLLREGGPNVVAVGGGHGLAMVVGAARHYASRVTGVVTVADDGGSSGRLTTAMDMLPPGDMRRVLLALSPEDTVLRRLFEYRFVDTDVAGHSLGNLILAALTDLLDDFEGALLTAAKMLDARGRILPVCTDSLELAAMIDGEVVEGQAAIADHPGHISQLVLRPPSVVNPDVVASIGRADQIVLGPGSLYTSVLSCLVVPGMTEAIDASNAELVYVLNLTTQHGETSHMSGLDHLQTLLEFSGLRRPGVVLAHEGAVEIPDDGAEPITIEASEVEQTGWRLARANLVDHTADWPQHDPTSLAVALRALA